MDGGGGGVPPALEKNAAELTVMDVYDIASAVGQEFERVIDQHGCEAIARLMPKVVRVLEILEVLVSRNHINPEMEELRLELDRLRLERMDRIEKERKHQKVRAGSGGTRRGRAALPCRSRSGGSRAPAAPHRISPCRRRENKERRRGAGRDAAEPWERAGHACGTARAAHGLCADAALASLRLWACCCFVSFPPGSFLPPSFSPPLPQSLHFLPLCLPD